MAGRRPAVGGNMLTDVMTHVLEKRKDPSSSID
jgi:hypothetical protein